MRSWPMYAAVTLVWAELTIACGSSHAPVVETRCGDGVVDSNEGCDDGNAIDDDWCSNGCVPALMPPEVIYRSSRDYHHSDVSFIGDDVLLTGWVETTSSTLISIARISPDGTQRWQRFPDTGYGFMSRAGPGGDVFTIAAVHQLVNGVFHVEDCLFRLSANDGREVWRRCYSEDLHNLAVASNQTVVIGGVNRTTSESIVRLRSVNGDGGTLQLNDLPTQLCGAMACRFWPSALVALGPADEPLVAAEMSPDGGTIRTMVARASSLGTPLWLWSEDTEWDDHLSGIAVSTGGEPFVVGWRLHGGYAESWVRSFSASGILQWTKSAPVTTYGGLGSFVMTGLVADQRGALRISQYPPDTVRIDHFSRNGDVTWSFPLSGYYLYSANSLAASDVALVVAVYEGLQCVVVRLRRPR